MANLIPTLIELKLDLLSRKAEVKCQMEGRKAAPVVRQTVKRQEIVLMNRSNLATHPLAPVSEIVGKVGRGATPAKKAKANNNEKAAEAAFCVALFGALRLWAVDFTAAERAQMARKLSTGSRARLKASDVLAAPVVETTVSTNNRPRFEHRTVEAPKGQAKAAITREKKRAVVALATGQAWDSQARVITNEQRQAARKALAVKKGQVMAVVSAIFGLLAEKRALQAQVDWHFGVFSRAVAFDITVELRARIQDINGQINLLLNGLTANDMRFMAFKAYRMVVGQIKAAVKRQAKADEAYWRAAGCDSDSGWDTNDYDLNCTLNKSVFVWSLSELTAA